MSDIRVVLPVPEEKVNGVLYVGDTGAGKTSLVLQQAISTHNTLAPQILLDTGDDMLNVLRSKGDPRSPVVGVDPFAVGWGGINVAAMVGSLTDCGRLAKKVYPDVRNDSQPFFNTSARNLFFAALAVLHHHAPGSWQLADAVRLAENYDLLKLLVPTVPGLRDPLKDVKATDGKLLSDVLTTATSRLFDLRVVSALMLTAPLQVNLLKPVGSTVLVWRDRYAASLEKLYAFAFDAVIEDALSRPFSERLWLYLDEFRQMDPIGGIQTALRRGRKHGVSVTLTMLEIYGLYDRYGKDVAEEMLGLTAHKVFLRIGSPGTAEWASKYLGSVDVIEDIPPHYTGGAYQRSGKERRNVSPDELRRLPNPSVAKDEIRGFIDCPDFTVPFVSKFLDTRRFPKGFKPIPSVPRPASDQVLPDLDARDLYRLNITVNKAILETLK